MELSSNRTPSKHSEQPAFLTALDFHAHTKAYTIYLYPMSTHTRIRSLLA